MQQPLHGWELSHRHLKPLSFAGYLFLQHNPAHADRYRQEAAFLLQATRTHGWRKRPRPSGQTLASPVPAPAASCVGARDAAWHASKSPAARRSPPSPCPLLGGWPHTIATPCPPCLLRVLCLLLRGLSLERFLPSKSIETCPHRFAWAQLPQVPQHLQSLQPILALPACDVIPSPLSSSVPPLNLTVNFHLRTIDGSHGCGRSVQGEQGVVA